MHLNLCVYLKTHGASKYRCSLPSQWNFSCSPPWAQFTVTNKRPHPVVSASHGSLRSLAQRGVRLGCFYGYKTAAGCPFPKQGCARAVQSHSSPTPHAPHCPSGSQGAGEARGQDVATMEGLPSLKKSPAQNGSSTQVHACISPAGSLHPAHQLLGLY